MKPYKQLVQVQRYQIFALQQAKHSGVEIAVILGVHKSTISRELSRNRGSDGWEPEFAHKKCVDRRVFSRAKFLAEGN